MLLNDPVLHQERSLRPDENLMKSLYYMFFICFNLSRTISRSVFYHDAQIMRYVQAAEKKSFEPGAFSFERLSVCCTRSGRQLLSYFWKIYNFLSNIVRSLTWRSGKEYGTDILRYKMFSCCIWRQKKRSLKSLVVRTDFIRNIHHVGLEIFRRKIWYLFPRNQQDSEDNIVKR